MNLKKNNNDGLCSQLSQVTLSIAWGHLLCAQKYKDEYCVLKTGQTTIISKFDMFFIQAFNNSCSTRASGYLLDCRRAPDPFHYRGGSIMQWFIPWCVRVFVWFFWKKFPLEAVGLLYQTSQLPVLLKLGGKFSSEYLRLLAYLRGHWNDRDAEQKEQLEAAFMASQLLCSSIDDMRFRNAVQAFAHDKNFATLIWRVRAAEQWVSFPGTGKEWIAGLYTLMTNTSVPWDSIVAFARTANLQITEEDSELRAMTLLGDLRVAATTQHAKLVFAEALKTAAHFREKNEALMIEILTAGVVKRLIPEVVQACKSYRLPRPAEALRLQVPRLLEAGFVEFAVLAASHAGEPLSAEVLLECACKFAEEGNDGVAAEALRQANRCKGSPVTLSR